MIVNRVHSPPRAAVAPGSETMAPTAAQALAQARELVEPAHRAAIDRLPSEAGHIARHHAG